MIYSSTSMRYFTRHCPKALDYHLKGAFHPKEIFQAGIAAHAVLEEIGRKKARDTQEMRSISNNVIDQLMQVGHSYYGAQEPPMQPEAAFEGRNLALSYAESNPVPEGQYEVPLAMDCLGLPCDHTDEKTRYRALIDLMYEDIEGDEDFSGKVLVVRDYKSAWPTGDSELDTLQRKGQAVMAFLNMTQDGIQGIRMEVVNIRSHKTFTKTIWLDDEGLETLEQWKNDILQMCKAADVTREARPGVGCLDCPWVMDCNDAQMRSNRAELPIDLACLEGTRKELIKRLKVTLKEAPAEVPGGEVGFRNESKKKPKEGAIFDIVRAFHVKLGDFQEDEGYETEVALLNTVGVGSGQVGNAAKVIFEGRDGKEGRESFLMDLLEDVGVVKFGIHKGGKL